MMSQGLGLMNQQFQEKISSMQDIIELDGDTVWHPYSAMGKGLPVFAVASAKGVRLRLADGRELIDGMSSGWCAIHGDNNPQVISAMLLQWLQLSLVLFGGLSHDPAGRLGQ